MFKSIDFRLAQSQVIEWLTHQKWSKPLKECVIFGLIKTKDDFSGVSSSDHAKRGVIL